MRIKDYQDDNDGDGYMPCPTCEGEGEYDEKDSN